MPSLGRGDRMKTRELNEGGMRSVENQSGESKCNKKKLMRVQVGMSTRLCFVRQLSDEADAENHDEKTYRHDHHETESKPAQHHGRGANTTLHATIAHVLSDGARGDGCGMLPENGDEDEDRCDEDESQGGLRDRSRRKRLGFNFGTTSIELVVPSGEGSQQDKTEEGEDDGDNATAS